jgi:hypothetical protein
MRLVFIITNLCSALRGRFLGFENSPVKVEEGKRRGISLWIGSLQEF